MPGPSVIETASDSPDLVGDHHIYAIVSSQVPGTERCDTLTLTKAPKKGGITIVLRKAGEASAPESETFLHSDYLPLLIDKLKDSSHRTIHPDLTVGRTGLSVGRSTFQLSPVQRRGLVEWLETLQFQPASPPDFDELHRVTIQKLDDVKAAIQDLRTALTSHD